MEHAETLIAHSDDASDARPNGAPSVSSSLVHLVSGSQRVITKRLDLALLEGQELVARSIDRAALVGAGIVLAAIAWFAGTGAFVLFVTPQAGLIVRLAAFALLNGAGAVGLVTLAMRRARPPMRGSNGSEPPPPREPLPAVEKD